MYDPSTGRFLSEDPIGFADGANRFRYAGNDPVNFSDPTGLSQAGNPLNNLLGGYSGNRTATRTPFVDSRNALQSPFLDINTLGRIGGNAIAGSLRATDPVGTSVINAGLGLGAAALFGPINYEPGKEFSSGRVSRSGKTFILNEPVLNAAGKPQRTAPIVGGSLDLKAFSAGEVEIAITGQEQI